MKRALILVATMVTTLLLFQLQSAKATVFYDWKDLHVNTGDTYSLNVSLPIDELEYRSGSFQVHYNELDDLLFTAVFPDGRSYQDRWSPSLFEFTYSYYLLGALSADKRKIEALVGYVPEFNVYLNGFDYFDSTYDAGLRASGDSMIGSIDVGIIFGPDYYMMPSNFDHTGEWVVREDTVPVPEPGTFVLLGIGAVGLLLARRKTSPLTFSPSE